MQTLMRDDSSQHLLGGISNCPVAACGHYLSYPPYAACAYQALIHKQFACLSFCSYMPRALMHFLKHPFHKQADAALALHKRSLHAGYA